MPFVIWMAVAVVALLVAERAGSQAGIWAAKPVAATAFVAAALAWGACGSTYGRLVLVALGFSWAGDVLLIPRSQALFRAGILAFLLGHLAYAVAFLALGVSLPWIAATLLVSAPVVVGVLRWLRPHVPPDMQAAVYAYVGVITMMVATAVGAAAAGGPLLALAGAAAFYLSDLSVARDRFVAPGFVNRAWGLPLYFGAQLLFAGSVR